MTELASFLKAMFFLAICAGVLLMGAVLGFCSACLVGTVLSWGLRLSDQMWTAVSAIYLISSALVGTIASGFLIPKIYRHLYHW